MVFGLPTPWFALCASIIVIWAAWEWTHLMRIVDTSFRIVYVLLVLLMMVLVSRYLQEQLPAYFLAHGYLVVASYCVNCCLSQVHE